MKVRPYIVFGIRQPTLDEIVLTKAERDVLRRAAVILEGVRDLRNSRVPTDWYAGDEDDSDLCFGVRICRDLAALGKLDAEEA
jgi:hypothetical protein